MLTVQFPPPIGPIPIGPNMLGITQQEFSYLFRKYYKINNDNEQYSRQPFDIQVRYRMEHNKGIIIRKFVRLFWTGLRQIKKSILAKELTKLFDADITPKIIDGILTGERVVIKNLTPKTPMHLLNRVNTLFQDDKAHIDCWKEHNRIKENAARHERRAVEIELELNPRNVLRNRILTLIRDISLETVPYNEYWPKEYAIEQIESQIEPSRLSDIERAELRAELIDIRNGIKAIGVEGEYIEFWRVVQFAGTH